MLNLLKFIGSNYPRATSKGSLKAQVYYFGVIRGDVFSFATQRRNYAREEDESPSRKGGKVEVIEKLKMPGFIHPEHITEEGYFAQKAKHELEELKKKAEKPVVDNKEKTE